MKSMTIMIAAAVVAVAAILTASSAYAQDKTPLEVLQDAYDDLTKQYVEVVGQVQSLNNTLQTQGKELEATKKLAGDNRQLYVDTYNNLTETVRQLNFDNSVLRGEVEALEGKLARAENNNNNNNQVIVTDSETEDRLAALEKQNEKQQKQINKLKDFRAKSKDGMSAMQDKIDNMPQQSEADGEGSVGTHLGFHLGERIQVKTDKKEYAWNETITITGKIEPNPTMANGTSPYEPYESELDLEVRGGNIQWDEPIRYISIEQLGIGSNARIIQADGINCVFTDNKITDFTCTVTVEGFFASGYIHVIYTEKYLFDGMFGPHDIEKGTYRSIPITIIPHAAQ